MCSDHIMLSRLHFHVVADIRLGGARSRGLLDIRLGGMTFSTFRLGGIEGIHPLSPLPRIELV